MRSDLTSKEDVAQHVDYLDGRDVIPWRLHDDFAVVDEGEVFVFVIVFVFAEHQFETAGVVAGLGGEGVARSGEQVDVGTSEVVNEVEIGER